MDIFKSKERKLSDRMKEQAVGLGLCAQWTDGWADGTTKDEMVEKFVMGLDFCIEHDWPSTDVMKREFGDVIHKHGVYVDERVTVEDPGTLVLNGRCDASVMCGRYAVSNIYIRHRSKAHITVMGHAYVHVSVYDGSEVSVSCVGPAAKCFVYRYGGKVRCRGNVCVREREGAPAKGVETPLHEDNKKRNVFV